MELIQYWVLHYGYGGVFIILLLEMIGIPFPAETTLTISGFAWQKGMFSLPVLLFSAGAGHFIGSMMAYTLGFYFGRPLVLRFGKYIGITDEKFVRLEVKFKRHGDWIVLFSKFIVGVRILVPYLSGINRMPWTHFTVFSLVGTLLWTSTFVLLGRYIEIVWNRYYPVIHPLLLPGILMVVIVFVVYYLFAKRTKKIITRQKGFLSVESRCRCGLTDRNLLILFISKRNL